MKKITTRVKQILNRFYLYKIIAFHIHKKSVEKNPIAEINRYYVSKFGHRADLTNPRSLIEKIYWMQLHCDTSLWTTCADKYRVREYIENKGFKEYLPKLYGMWEKPKQINPNMLPKSFVLKANNGCATVLIVKDKDKIDWNSQKKKMRQWISIPFGYSGYEPHYLKIKPCIIAEELLVQNKELDVISPESMVDFKLWCFNGHVESCLVTYNRNKGFINIDLYDRNWVRISDNLRNYDGFHVPGKNHIPKPICWEEMVSIASELSKGFPEIRIDFYVVDNKPVIGELTLSSGYGYFTEDYYNYLGAFVDTSLLSKIR